MTSEEIENIYKLDLDSMIRVPNYQRPLIIENGLGCMLYDIHGKGYLDFTAGWNVTNLGWSNKELLDTLSNPNISSYTPNWFLNSSKVKYAKAISDLMNGEYKILYGVSGSDSVEFAMKAAIKATKRNAFLSFSSSYHGATLSLLAAGNEPQINSNYFLTQSNFSHLPMHSGPTSSDQTEYMESILKIINQAPAPAAILFEPVFTNPGILYGSPLFYSVICEEVRKRGGLVIVDEVATGFCRTGQFFSYQHFDIKPDIIVLGKAITSGCYPLSAILVKNGLTEFSRGVGFHSTYGGTPMACEVAYKTLSILLENDYPSRVLAIGEKLKKHIFETFKGKEYMHAVRGLGLCLGIQLRTKEQQPIPISIMEQIRKHAEINGLIVQYSSHIPTFLIMPPLTIGEFELQEGIAILQKAFDEILL